MYYKLALFRKGKQIRMPTPIDVLQQLVNLQNLNIVSDIDQIVNQLQKPFENYAELEFRSDGKQIDLITLSNDLKVVNTFVEILEGRGTTANELSHLKALIRFGAGKVIGMKLPLTEPTNGGEIYIRGALPLEEVNPFLSRHGVKSEAIEIVGKLGSVFDKTYTHMLGADATNPPTFTLFFTTYLTEDDTNTDQERLKKALKIVSVNDETSNTFLSLHHLLGSKRPKTLFFSWGIANGESTSQAKIDYEDVRLGIAAEVVDVVSTAKQADILIQWGEQLGLQKANYAGVVVDSTKLKTVRAYFTRRLPKS